MTELNFKKLINTIAGFVVLGILIVISVYTYQFQHGSLGDTASFGAFGDYIGGLLNPILGFATVLLLIYSIRIQMRELSKSTAALEASQEAQENLVAISKQEVTLLQESRLDEQNALKTESKRNQLTENLEIIIKKFDELMRAPYLNSNHSQFSLYDLLYNVTELDDFIVKNRIEKIQTLMTEELDNRNDRTKRIQLEAIKKNMQLMVLVLMELKPMLEIECLQIIWMDRLITRARDCRVLTILTDKEFKNIEKCIKKDSINTLF